MIKEISVKLDEKGCSLKSTADKLRSVYSSQPKSSIYAKKCKKAIEGKGPIK